MRIDLEADEVSVLRDVLQEKVTQLDKQINAAESITYKGTLRETGRTLERILGRVTQSTAGPADWQLRDEVDEDSGTQS